MLHHREVTFDTGPNRNLSASAQDRPARKPNQTAVMNERGRVSHAETSRWRRSTSVEPGHTRRESWLGDLLLRDALGSAGGEVAGQELVGAQVEPDLAAQKAEEYRTQGESDMAEIEVHNGLHKHSFAMREARMPDEFESDAKGTEDRDL